MVSLQLANNRQCLYKRWWIRSTTGVNWVCTTVTLAPFRVYFKSARWRCFAGGNLCIAFFFFWSNSAFFSHRTYLILILISQNGYPTTTVSLVCHLSPLLLTLLVCWMRMRVLFGHLNCRLSRLECLFACIPNQTNVCQAQKSFWTKVCCPPNWTSSWGT